MYIWWLWAHAWNALNLRGDFDYNRFGWNMAHVPTDKKTKQQSGHEMTGGDKMQDSCRVYKGQNIIQ
jgi:hypothetical protein